MGKKGSVKQAEAVQRFFQQNAGKEFCHNCLARAVGFKSVHRSIIQLINNPFFARRRGRCEACASHRPKLLTRYRGKPSPHEQNGIPILGRCGCGARTRSVQRIALRQRPDAGSAFSQIKNPRLAQGALAVSRCNCELISDISSLGRPSGS